MSDPFKDALRKAGETSDTPETDANELIKQEDSSPFAPIQKLVHSDFARNLERQRNEARELLASEKSTRNAIIAKGIETERQLAEAREENVRLRDALDTLTLVIGLTPIAGNKEALQEAFDNARKLLTP